MLVAGAAGPGGVGVRVGQAPQGSGPWKEGPCGLCRCHGKRTFPKGFHHAGGTASALPLRQWGFQEGVPGESPFAFGRLLAGSWWKQGKGVGRSHLLRRPGDAKTGVLQPL